MENAAFVVLKSTQGQMKSQQCNLEAALQEWTEAPQLRNKHPRLSKWGLYERVAPLRPSLSSHSVKGTLQNQCASVKGLWSKADAILPSCE